MADNSDVKKYLPIFFIVYIKKKINIAGADIIVSHLFDLFIEFGWYCELYIHWSYWDSNFSETNYVLASKKIVIALSWKSPNLEMNDESHEKWFVKLKYCLFAGNEITI